MTEPTTTSRTVRFSADMDQAIRARAAKNNRTLQQEVEVLLQAGLSTPAPAAVPSVPLNEVLMGVGALKAGLALLDGAIRQCKPFLIAFI